jgi:hypothetical protein
MKASKQQSVVARYMRYQVFVVHKVRRLSRQMDAPDVVGIRLSILQSPQLPRRTTQEAAEEISMGIL